MCLDCKTKFNHIKGTSRRHCEECRSERARLSKETAILFTMFTSLLKKEASAQRRFQERPWLVPGLSWAEKQKLRKKLDPSFRIDRQMQKKRRAYFSEQELKASLLSNSEGRGYIKILGYSSKELRRHIELQFENGMTWDGYARGEIEIDHRIPLACFNLKEPDEIRAAWAITNLQPLWAADNRTKGAKRLYLL